MRVFHLVFWYVYYYNVMLLEIAFVNSKQRPQNAKGRGVILVIKMMFINF